MMQQRRRLLDALLRSLVGVAGTSAIDAACGINGARRVELSSAAGDGSTDDRAAIQTVLNRVGAEGGGAVLGMPGRTYLVGPAPGKQKYVGKFPRAFGIEIPDNVSLDLRGATLAARPDTDYVLVTNVRCIPGRENNVGVELKNAIIDFHAASRAGHAAAIAFYGVRRLRLDALEVRNGFNIALDLESCDAPELGRLTFRNCTGAAFYVGGAVASGGGEIRGGRVNSVVVSGNRDHPNNPGLPGNPVLLNAIDMDIGQLIAEDCDAGIKITAGRDLRIERVSFRRGRTQNSGFKVQGANDDQTVKRVRVGNVHAADCGGTGLLIAWAKDIVIQTYLGERNGALGQDADARIAGDAVRIGQFTSIESGRSGIEVTNFSGRLHGEPPECVITSAEIKNPWAAAASSNSAAVYVREGRLEVESLSVSDDRARAKLARATDDATHAVGQGAIIGRLQLRGVPPASTR